MISQFEMLLRDGRQIYVDVETDIIYNCDCWDELHPHIEQHEIVQVVDSATGIDVILTDSIREEIEQAADAEVYAECDAA